MAAILALAYFAIVMRSYRGKVRPSRRNVTADDMSPAAGVLTALVVVGSSAGGIEALSTLVASLPARFPAPIILAQHLDPRYPSHLHEILARHAALPVRRVTVDPAKLEPGAIYVVPADHHVRVTDHTVQLLQQDGKGPKPSIDMLLTTAAEVFADVPDDDVAKIVETNARRLFRFPRAS